LFVGKLLVKKSSVLNDILLLCLQHIENSSETKDIYFIQYSLATQDNVIIPGSIKKSSYPIAKYSYSQALQCFHDPLNKLYISVPQNEEFKYLVTKISSKKRDSCMQRKIDSLRLLLESVEFEE